MGEHAEGAEEAVAGAALVVAASLGNGAVTAPQKCTPQPVMIVASAVKSPLNQMEKNLFSAGPVLASQKEVPATALTPHAPLAQPSTAIHTAIN